MIKQPIKVESRPQIGVFIGGAVVIVLLVLWAMARAQGWFDKTFELQFQASSAESLSQGMLVRLSGLPIGKVTRITLEDDARVRVLMRINEDFRHWIKRDSKAILAHEGMFGDSYIQITPGKDSGSPLVDKNQLPFESGGGIAELIQQVQERLFPLLEDMRALAQQLRAPDGAFNSTFVEAKALLKELRTTRLALDKALQGAQALTEQKFPATLNHIDNTVAEFKTLATNTDARLDAISKKLQETLDHYDQTGETANTAVKELQVLLTETRPALQRVLQDADVVMRSANQTMTNMNENWPFSGDAKPAQMPAQNSIPPKN